MMKYSKENKRYRNFYRIKCMNIVIIEIKRKKKTKQVRGEWKTNNDGRKKKEGKVEK